MRNICILRKKIIRTLNWIFKELRKEGGFDAKSTEAFTNLSSGSLFSSPDKIDETGNRLGSLTAVGFFSY